MALVKFTNVGLRYSTGPEVLQDVSFELEEGSYHFLTGTSGAGKTSLMKLLYLGQRPTRGMVTMFGKDLAKVKRKDMPDIRRQIGVVFQDFRLMHHLSAFDNVALPLRVCGVAEKNIKSDVAELLHWVGLGDKMNARPTTLSGGEQQRVAIARAVVNRPRLLLADEPTGNVDDGIGLRLLQLFEELNRHGTTLVIATHNLTTLQSFPHPCLHIDRGHLTVETFPQTKAA